MQSLSLLLQFLVSDVSSASDELGQAVLTLLRKYLDQIYDPASAQPSGVTSASVSDSGFFRPPPSSQSGISVPSDLLTDFDRVATFAILKPTPPISGFGCSGSISFKKKKND